jgi:hypothetical protein
MSPPILSYVAAIDVLSSAYGSTMYNIFFDSDIVTNGNLLMFEYKLQSSTDTDPVPGNITLGFINIENSSQIGISNQWRISVPASNDDYISEDQVQVRIYYGVLNSIDITVTEWSNLLDVHNPPATPDVPFALYNTPSLSNLDDLFIVLTPNTEIDYSVVKFIVAYYYQDLSNNTVWEVSDLIEATNTTYDGDSAKLLEIIDFGSVSQQQDSSVYVAVYAVYPFQYNSSNYYSVSGISNTFSARPTDQFDAPDIDTINYQVYDTDTRDQNMIITWDAPLVDIMPIYRVQSYTLEYTTTDPSAGPVWTVISAGLTNLSYMLDVSNISTFPIVGTTVYYRVKAIDVNGTISPYSDTKSKNIYYYSTAPTELTISEISVNSNNSIDMTVNFQNPTNIGSGDPSTAYFTVIINGQTQNPINYNSTSDYNISYTNLNINSSGTVQVYLNTQNTNPDPDGLLPGASVSTEYVASVLELSAPVYNIYNSAKSQSMSLVWTDVTVTGWAVYYEVQLRLNNNNYINVGDTNDSNFSYTIPSGEQTCGNTFVFQVIATLTKTNQPTYTITSNPSDSLYMFKYAEAPLVTVNWASALSTSTSTSTMDVLVTFLQPNVGCGNPVDFTVNVYDSLFAVLDTQTVTLILVFPFRAPTPLFILTTLVIVQQAQFKYILQQLTLILPVKKMEQLVQLITFLKPFRFIAM